MKLDLTVQNLVEQQFFIPTQAQFERWIITSLNAIQYPHSDAELCIRLVSNQDMQAMNLQYRNQDKATNILSFPFEEEDEHYFGDLVIAPEVLACEAAAYKISAEDHWAHIVVHGVLHLLGFDHIQDDEAEKMQALEAKILQQLLIDNPYGRHL